VHEFDDVIRVHRQNSISGQILSGEVLSGEVLSGQVNRKKLDSNIRQIPITAVPAPSLRHGAEPRKSEKPGTLSRAAEMALAAKCGDDKDAITSI
jgi:hypothetical protein